MHALGTLARRPWAPARYPVGLRAAASEDAGPRPLAPGVPPPPKEQRIFGLPAGAAVRVAIPVIGGLLAAFGGVMSLRPGNERTAQMFFATWALLTSATAAAEALQQASDEEAEGRR